MTIIKWLNNNTKSLKGKTVALTGSTGGIGKELVRYLVLLDANIILLDRNKERSEKYKLEYPCANIECITLDLIDINNVKEVTNTLIKRDIYAIIHNAGAYKIPTYKCQTNYINTFQINFLSPYYMIKN